MRIEANQVRSSRVSSWELSHLTLGQSTLRSDLSLCSANGMDLVKDLSGGSNSISKNPYDDLILACHNDSVGFSPNFILPFSQATCYHLS